jgi:ribonuclease VapC
MTIVLDTSAVIAVLTKEAGWEHLLDRLFQATFRLLPAPSAGEAYIVLSSKLPGDPGKLLHDFCLEHGIQVVPFTADHVSWFQFGYSRFGKGRHKAALNFGDCFAYAVAKAGGYPLLYVGGDFAVTDVASA